MSENQKRYVVIPIGERVSFAGSLKEMLCKRMEKHLNDATKELQDNLAFKARDFAENLFKRSHGDYGEFDKIFAEAFNKAMEEDKCGAANVIDVAATDRLNALDKADEILKSVADDFRSLQHYLDSLQTTGDGGTLKRVIEFRQAIEAQLKEYEPKERY